MNVRVLTSADWSTAAFRHLLWLAVEVDDTELRRIIDDDLGQLTVIGVVLDAEVVGFVAYALRPQKVVIEYIATAPSQRGVGLGIALVGEIRRRHPGLTVEAETDDDAIGFYRRIGFDDRPGASDPRWPDRPRYCCTLPPS